MLVVMPADESTVTQHHVITNRDQILGIEWREWSACKRKGQWGKQAVFVSFCSGFRTGEEWNESVAWSRMAPKMMLLPQRATLAPYILYKSRASHVPPAAERIVALAWARRRVTCGAGVRIEGFAWAVRTV